MKNISKREGKQAVINLLTASLLLFFTAASANKNANDEGGLGEWTDSATKITWAHCSAGQQWDGQACNGDAKKMNWAEAQAYANSQKNWRLPRIDELVTIRWCLEGWLRSESEFKAAALGAVYPAYIPNDRGTIKYVPLICKPVKSIIPSINQLPFPNTAIDEGYWSSSTQDTSKLIWAVHFGGGYGYNTNNEAHLYVRLVKDN